MNLSDRVYRGQALDLTGRKQSVGIVSRLVDQKQIDIVAQMIRDIQQGKKQDLEKNQHKCALQCPYNHPKIRIPSRSVESV